MRSICSPLHRALAGGALARLRASTLPAASRQLHHRPRTALVRPQPARPRSLAPLTRLRLESSARAPAASAPAPPAAPAVPAAVPSLGAGRSKEDAPAYELTFTCKRCAERSTHRVSKQGFHHGTVLITCPGCKNRHLISDHLKIFSDKSITIEDILREKGEAIKRGFLGGDGDVEFWDDGTITARSPKTASS